MRHTLLFTTIIFVTTSNFYAQVNFQWAKRAGNLGVDEGATIVADASGNVYSSGRYQDTVDFDPGAGVFNLNPTNTYNTYLSKLDASGNFVWAKGIGFSGISFIEQIVLDNSNNIYVAGWMQGTGDLDPNSGVSSITAVGGTDIFVCKYDNMGNLVWAKQMAGTANETAYGICVNGAGETFLTGYFEGTVDFDPGAAVNNYTAVNSDIFVSKLDASGNFVWTKQMGGAEYEHGRSIIVDGTGDLFFTGAFQDVADFDPNAGITTLTSGGTSDVFVSKLDASGNLIWAKGAGATLNDYGRSISKDPSGNVYITGTYINTVDFDPSASVSSITSSGLTDTFIWKLDASGSLVWIKSVGTSGSNDLARSINVDALGNSYTSGSFGNSGDFDPGVSVFNLTSAGANDGYIVKLNSSGDFVWAHNIGGPTNDYSSSSTIDASGNIYSTGAFGSTADFDPTASTFNLAASGSQDIYILKWYNSIVGINESNDSGDERLVATIFPNPNSGISTLKIDIEQETKLNIDVFNEIGQSVYSVPEKNYFSGNNMVQINLSELSNGFYFVKIHNQQTSKTLKLVINR